MKAFVRFRLVHDLDGTEAYVAWHRPDHRIVRLVATFFARRFSGMNWSILTPHESVSWNQELLTYGAGVSSRQAPDEDELEELWRTYYASIFNPARVKVAAMKREMPVRHWPTLPEASLIDDLLRSATSRVNEMIERDEGFSETATTFMPSFGDLDSLRIAAPHCQACPLHLNATQSVFGEGSSAPRLVVVGEQPGDLEDLAGRPFVGPAGELLDEALRDAGIDRSTVYITNVVKHFKFTEISGNKGKQRLHKKPNSREIYACRPWLEAELTAIEPTGLICLGATPAQALIGRDFRITQRRGELISTPWCDRTMATWHPAALLRMPDPARRSIMRNQLIADLSAMQPSA